MKSPLSKAEISSVLGEGAFVRLAAQDDALFVSDAPRLLPADRLIVAQNALSRLGYQSWINSRGLLALDWDEARWRAFTEKCAITKPALLPADQSLENVYALARLLAVHPAPLEKQPKPLLRALLKRYHQPAGMIEYAPAALSACARQLRTHEPLPYAGAGILFAWLRERCEEEIA